MLKWPRRTRPMSAHSLRTCAYIHCTYTVPVPVVSRSRGSVKEVSARQLHDVSARGCCTRTRETPARRVTALGCRVRRRTAARATRVAGRLKCHWRHCGHSTSADCAATCSPTPLDLGGATCSKDSSLTLPMVSIGSTSSRGVRSTECRPLRETGNNARTMRAATSGGVG